MPLSVTGKMGFEKRRLSGGVNARMLCQGLSKEVRKVMDVGQDSWDGGDRP